MDPFVVLLVVGIHQVFVVKWSIKLQHGRRAQTRRKRTPSSVLARSLTIRGQLATIAFVNYLLRLKLLWLHGSMHLFHHHPVLAVPLLAPFRSVLRSHLRNLQHLCRFRQHQQRLQRFRQLQLDLRRLLPFCRFQLHQQRLQHPCRLRLYLQWPKHLCRFRQHCQRLRLVDQVRHYSLLHRVRVVVASSAWESPINDNAWDIACYNAWDNAWGEGGPDQTLMLQ